jgi:hypothetical protein
MVNCKYQQRLTEILHPSEAEATLSELIRYCIRGRTNIEILTIRTKFNNWEN